MAGQPYEIVIAPADVYIAPVGESFPAVTASPPGGNWTLIGTIGNENYGEDGVTISYEETVEDHRGLGSTGILKSGRTEESLLVNFMLHDLTLEEVTRALNFRSVATETNDKVLDLYQGHEVAYRALLVRSVSAYQDSANAQYELPRVRSAGTPEVIYRKGEAAGLAMAFRVLHDLNAASDADRFGRWRDNFQ